MANKRPRIRLNSKRFWLTAGLTLLVLACITLFTARQWVKTDDGRRFVSSLIDGQHIPSLGTLRISGLTGDPLSSANLNDLAIVDDQGIWLRSTDVTFKWNPLALLTNRVSIQSVTIERARLQRRPTLSQPTPNRSSSSRSYALGSFELNELTFNDGLHATHTSYNIKGRGTYSPKNAGNLHLSLAPNEQNGDTLNLNAVWSKTGKIDATLRADGNADGILASLLNAQPRTSLTIEGQANGTFNQNRPDFTANLETRFADTPVLQFNINATPQNATASATLDAQTWPLFAPLANRLGPTLQLNASTNRTTTDTADLTLNLQAGLEPQTTTAQVNATFNPNTAALTEPAAFTVANIRLPNFTSTITNGTANITGELNGTTSNWTVNATANTGNVTTNTASFHASIIPFTLTNNDAAIEWTIDNAIFETPSIASVIDLPPTIANLNATGSWGTATADTPPFLNIETGDLTAASLRSNINGTYTPATGKIELQGDTLIPNLADMSPLSGSANLNWTAKRLTDASPIVLEAIANTQNFKTDNTFINGLSGTAPRAEISLAQIDGVTTIENASINSATTTLTATGDINTKALAITVNATQHTSTNVGPTTLSNANLTGQITGTPTNPEFTITLNQANLSTAFGTINAIRGTLNRTGSTNHEIAADLQANLDQTPFTLTTNLTRQESAWALTNLNVATSALQLNSPSLRPHNNFLDGQVTAAGSLAGIAGFTNGTIDLNATLTTDQNHPLANISGTATNIQRGPLNIPFLEFLTNLTRDTVDIRLDAKTNLPTKPTLTLIANGTRDDKTWSGTATLDGQAGNQPITTPTPAIWSAAPNTYTLNANLRALNGTTSTKLQFTPTQNTLSLTSNNLSIRALSKLFGATPLDGTINTDVNLIAPHTPNTKRTGTAQITVIDPGSRNDPATHTTTQISANLVGNALTIATQGAPTNRTPTDATATLPFKVESTLRTQIAGSGLMLTPNPTAQVFSEATYQGPAEKIWALTNQPNMALAGHLNAHLNAQGTLNNLSLNGEAHLSNARFDHATTGFHLNNLTATTRFTGNKATITNLTGNDAHGGHVKGSGQISWNGTLNGGLTFNADHLHVLARDDRAAAITGDGTLTIKPTAVEVAGSFNVEEANFSTTQPATTHIPTLPNITRRNFTDTETNARSTQPQRPIKLDLNLNSERKILVRGRGLDLEWSGDLNISGTPQNPIVTGQATLVRGDLNLAGRRFPFDTGSIQLNGPIREAELNITASGKANDIDAQIQLSGTPTDPVFTLTSSPSLPQDEILARILFGRSATQLSGLETAQLAAALAQLASGEADFDPTAPIRQATGLDRISLEADGENAALAAGKYIADNVYIELGTGHEGGAAAEIEWQANDDFSVISSAKENGDTRMTIRWKKDY